MGRGRWRGMGGWLRLGGRGEGMVMGWGMGDGGWGI